MSKTTDIRTVKAALALKFDDHLPNRDIARRLGIGAATVSDILGRFKGLSMSWPLSDADDEKLKKSLYPQGQVKRAIPDYAQIDIELRKPGVTKLLLWEEYHQQNPDNAYGYSQYCDNYKLWKSQQKPSMRMHHKAGEKVFVDFCGPTMPIVNPETGEYRQAQVFVGILGASNYTYAQACENQQMESWLNAHAGMFEYFGGVPKIIVPDYVPRNIIGVMWP